MKKIIFLVSGGGGTLRYIYNATILLQESYRIQAVISDRESDAIKFAEEHSIPNYLVSYKRNSPDELNTLLKELNADIVVTNIHKILDETTLNCCSSTFINLHYSLLPSFKGLIGMATVDKAKELNVRFIGASSHHVTEEVDAGTIICQASFIPKWDKQKINIIYDTIFQSGCLVLLSSILSLSGRVLTENESNKIIVINENIVTFSDELPINNNIHSKVIQSI